MDFRTDSVSTPLARAARARPLAARAVDARPVLRVPPRGKGRRLPAPRAPEPRESRRSSGRRQRSVGEVNATITAPPAPTRVPARWARFEALVLEAGVSRGRLLDAFPDVEDIEDIFHTPDADLAACAATLVEALGVDRPATPGTAPAVVRCADCRHFARSPTHPRLGRCGAGERATAAGGWWDTQSRSCETFAARVPPPVVRQST